MPGGSPPHPHQAGRAGSTSAKRRSEVELGHLAAGYDHGGDWHEISVKDLVGALGQLGKERHWHLYAADVAEVNAGVEPQQRDARRLRLELRSGGHDGEVDDQGAHLTAHIEHGPVTRVVMS